MHQYTSHISGIVSAAADNLAAGKLWVVFDGLLALLAFGAGALISTVLIRWGKDHGLLSRYALPLLTEAVLLTVFGLSGKEFTGARVVRTIMLLCFTMGLQNAMITKISGSVIRTTHLTGMVTDIGISIGRILFATSQPDFKIDDELNVLRLLGSLVLLFFVGGVTGDLGFKHVGFLFALPLAMLLLMLAFVPVVDDLRSQLSASQ